MEPWPYGIVNSRVTGAQVRKAQLQIPALPLFGQMTWTSVITSLSQSVKWEQEETLQRLIVKME